MAKFLHDDDDEAEATTILCRFFRKQPSEKCPLSLLGLLGLLCLFVQ